MSIKAINWAFSMHMKPELKFVLVTLADTANDNGECWPGIAHISNKVEMSERTVIRKIADLVRLGYIEKDKRKGPDGRRKSNLYRLKIEASPYDNLSHGPYDKSGENHVPNDASPCDNAVTPNMNEPSVNTTVNNNPQRGDVDARQQDEVLAGWIFELIQKLNPSHKQPSWHRWVKDIQLMRTVDKRTRKEIAELFKWANQHHFWQTNILSPASLRKHWDTLVIQKSGNKTKANSPNAVDHQCAHWHNEVDRCKRAGITSTDNRNFYCREHQPPIGD
jgi:hypothetical protein